MAGPFCGGSLIDLEYVLTAAHCMLGERRSDVIVRLGEFDWQEVVEVLPHEHYTIERVIPYRGYSESASEHDIALLKLSGRVEPRSHIKVIPLVEDDTGFEGTPARVSGWGLLGELGPKAEKLHEVNVKIVKIPHAGKFFGLDNILLAGVEEGFW